MSEEVSGALPSLISLTVSVDVKPYVLLLLRHKQVNTKTTSVADKELLFSFSRRMTVQPDPVETLCGKQHTPISEVCTLLQWGLL